MRVNKARHDDRLSQVEDRAEMPRPDETPAANRRDTISGNHHGAILDGRATDGQHDAGPQEEWRFDGGCWRVAWHSRIS